MNSCQKKDHFIGAGDVTNTFLFNDQTFYFTANITRTSNQKNKMIFDLSGPLCIGLTHKDESYIRAPMLRENADSDMWITDFGLLETRHVYFINSSNEAILLGEYNFPPITYSEMKPSEVGAEKLTKLAIAKYKKEIEGQLEIIEMKAKGVSP